MQLAQYLVTSGYSKTRNGLKATVEGQVIFELGKAIPWFQEGNGCMGLAKPFEIHMNQYGTTVFFQFVEVPKDVAKALYQYYCIVTGTGHSGARRVDSETARTGMDAATRMMMGETRSPRQIGRDAGRGFYDDDDDGPEGIYEMMKRSNPGDSFFDD